MTSENISMLKNFSNAVRRKIVGVAEGVGSVHFGGCFSVVEMIAAYLEPVIRRKMSFDQFVKKNLLVMSKGHCGLTYYAALAECGVILQSELEGYCQDGGRFLGHIKRDLSLGAGWSTGSLGHGLSISMGYAAANQLVASDQLVTCILGDGEMNEGSNWEALIHLSMRQPCRLRIVLDNNGLLSLGPTDQIRKISPMEQKLNAFGVDNRVVDGHDFRELLASFDMQACDLPRFIVANTVKGKGVSFMEANSEWHAKRADANTLARILGELSQP